jgi:hypothetical protein
MTEHMLAHTPEEVIWKYEVNLVDDVEIVVPQGTRFLPHVTVTPDGAVSLWGIVTPGNVPVTRRVFMRGTGHTFNEMVGAGYLATATTDANGVQYVLHVFVDPGERVIS